MPRASSNKELLILNKLNNLFKSIPVSIINDEVNIDEDINEDDDESNNRNENNTFYVKDNFIIFDGGDGLSPVSFIKIPNNECLLFLKNKTFKINCKQFFTYLKDYGKDADEIKYENNKISFITSKATEEFISDYSSEDDKKIDELADKIRKFNNDKKDKEFKKYYFTQELIDKFKSDRIYHLYFNKDGTIDGNIDKDKNEFRLDIFYKYFIRIAKTSKVTCNVTSFDNNLKYLVFIIETDNIKSFQCFKIIADKLEF